MGKKFDKLARHIEDEYKKKGYSDKEARYIGRATAGEVADEKGDDGGKEDKHDD